MAKKNKYLVGGTPEELAKIQAIRARLVFGNTDRDDHLAIVDDWEKRVKAALISLNLKKHEGIKMLMKKAATELVEISEALQVQQPKSLSPEHAVQFASETMMLHERKRLWEWFIHLFSEAQQEIDTIMSEVALEFAEENLDEDEDDPLEDIDENPIP